MKFKYLVLLVAVLAGRELFAAQAHSPQTSGFIQEGQNFIKMMNNYKKNEPEIYKLLQEIGVEQQFTKIWHEYRQANTPAQQQLGLEKINALRSRVIEFMKVLEGKI